MVGRTNRPLLPRLASYELSQGPKIKMHATLAVNLSRKSTWLKVLGSRCSHLCWWASPAPLGKLMRVTSSESGYVARWLRYEAVVVSNKHQSQGGSHGPLFVRRTCVKNSSDTSYNSCIPPCRLLWRVGGICISALTQMLSPRGRA